MNRLVKVLVSVFVGAFALTAVVLALRGQSKAAMGAFIVAALIAPTLLDAWYPGKYLLRKPDNEMPDTLFYRLKQFRADHRGKDGTLILSILVLLGIGLFGSALLRLVQIFMHK